MGVCTRLGPFARVATTMAGTKRVADLAKLPQQWENVRELRAQVAAGKSLMVSTVAHTSSCLGNLRDCSANYYAWWKSSTAWLLPTPSALQG